MSVWEFLNNNIYIVFIAIVLIFGLVFLLVKNNGKFKFKNNEISFGKGRTQEDIIRDTLLLNTIISNWQSNLNKKINKQFNETIGSTIRYAAATIDTNINKIKIDYGKFLREEKGEINQNDNYEIIIFGFLIDKIREDTKDIICAAIREDHFDTKTQKEIEAISQNCVDRAIDTLNSQGTGLNAKIVNKIINEHKSKLFTICDDIIQMSIKKYNELSTKNAEIISNEINNFKEDIKLKFPILHDEAIDSIAKFYEYR